jgi:hypothetical protein
MQFLYKKFKLTDGTELLKPIIPIGLLLNDKLIRYEALIDSGADFNIFNAEIGELLGINIRSGKKVKFSGIAGEPFEVYLHNLTLEVGGWQYKIVAGFSYQISPYGFGILGQKGFFDLFRIKFIFSRGIIEITPER